MHNGASAFGAAQRRDEFRGLDNPQEHRIDEAAEPVPVQQTVSAGVPQGLRTEPLLRRARRVEPLHQVALRGVVASSVLSSVEIFFVPARRRNRIADPVIGPLDESRKG